MCFSPFFASKRHVHLSFSYLLNQFEPKITCLATHKHEKISVPCWTDNPGFAELIGVVCFKKNADGNVIYEFDDSESTL